MNDLHKDLVELAEKHGAEAMLEVMKNVASGNFDGCPGHDGECGVCIGSTFVACGEPQDS